MAELLGCSQPTVSRLATGYRGLLHRFPIFLDVIAKLEIYRTS